MLLLRIDSVVTASEDEGWSMVTLRSAGGGERQAVRVPTSDLVTIDYEVLIGEAVAKSVQFHNLTEKFAFAVASETIGIVAAAIGDTG